VLHLLAIAHEAEVELTLDDFNRIGDRTPHLADVKPFGRYVMNDIDAIGGVPSSSRRCSTRVCSTATRSP
jgi:dihydroxy-acid dehydratase